MSLKVGLSSMPQTLTPMQVILFLNRTLPECLAKSTVLPKAWKPSKNSLASHGMNNALIAALCCQSLAAIFHILRYNFLVFKVI